MSTLDSNLVRKPKNARSKRAQKEKEAKLVENPKKALFVKGHTCSQLVWSVMQDFVSLLSLPASISLLLLTDFFQNLIKKPLGIMYSKSNEVYPFENPTSLEFFAQKCDASLAMFGSHNKKRPQNAVFARFFGSKLLDMIEVGISNFKPITSFKVFLSVVSFDTITNSFNFLRWKGKP